MTFGKFATSSGGILTHNSMCVRHLFGLVGSITPRQCLFPGDICESLFCRMVAGYLRSPVLGALSKCSDVSSG